jgi:hypothetical protein
MTLGDYLDFDKQPLVAGEIYKLDSRYYLITSIPTEPNKDIPVIDDAQTSGKLSYSRVGELSKLEEEGKRAAIKTLKKQVRFLQNDLLRRNPIFDLILRNRPPCG